MSRFCNGAALALLVIAASAASQASAQTAPPPTIQWQGLDHPENYKPPAKRVSPGEGYSKVTSTAPTPRKPNGKPDLTGVWGATPPSPAGPGRLRRLGTNELDQLVLQRGSGWNKPLYKPEFWEKVRGLDFSRVDVDPAYNCDAPGVPRQNAPTKIVQLDNEVILFRGEAARNIPIDGRKHGPDDIDETYSNGVGVGHWDGDTLVVESIGFNDTTWLQFQGYFHTDQMKVIERFWRQGNLLFYNWTVEDPDVLVEPWTQDTTVRILNPAPFVRINEPPPCVPTGIPENMPYSRG